MATLLSIVQQVADRLSLVRPSQVVGAADQQVRQLLSVANQEGREQARRNNWQALTKEQTFSTIAQESQTSAIPADFDRFVPGTFYNRTQSCIVTGPLTAQEYADYKGRVATTVLDAFRVRGDAILILPTPPAGETMAFEYVTKYWCGAAADTAPTQDEWVADDDIPFLDTEAMIQGTLWRFQKANGLDYAESFQSYELHLMQLMGRDGGSRILRMGSPPPFRPMAPLPPDGNWDLS